ncbi:MAG: tRNA (adenosine(37)-N6)-threonylcarbamoyltransferase complex dimerization subunit type 1 TsaB [Pseudomonadota bacterium]
MNFLAFDTSTETLSVALDCGGRVTAHTGAGGAQASAALIPAVRALLDAAGLRLAELDAIAFGRGPGSFTGLRTACAVAQGLGMGANVPLLPLDTLLALAEDARAEAGVTQVVALLDARMGEVYWGAYAFDGTAWQCAQPPQLAQPEQVQVPAGWHMAGNAIALYKDRLPAAAGAVPAQPRAEALLRLAPAELAAGRGRAAADALPLYIRDKVAQTTDERAALRRQQAAAGSGR